MSTIDRHISGRVYNFNNFYPLTMLSLNEIFKESMRKVVSERTASKVIARCENLPDISGNKEDIVDLFEELIGMIVTDKTAPTKLFLYIDCEESKDENLLKHFSEGFKTYTIKFRTNISPTKNWEEEHEMALNKCREIVSAHNAIFLVNSSNQTGCIFSITLPGKY